MPGPNTNDVYVVAGQSTHQDTSHVPYETPNLQEKTNTILADLPKLSPKKRRIDYDISVTPEDLKKFQINELENKKLKEDNTRLLQKVNNLSENFIRVRAFLNHYNVFVAKPGQEIVPELALNWQSPVIDEIKQLREQIRDLLQQSMDAQSRYLSEVKQLKSEKDGLIKQLIAINPDFLTHRRLDAKLHDLKRRNVGASLDDTNRVQSLVSQLTVAANQVKKAKQESSHKDEVIQALVDEARALRDRAEQAENKLSYLQTPNVFVDLLGHTTEGAQYTIPQGAAEAVSSALQQDGSPSLSVSTPIVVSPTSTVVSQRAPVATVTTNALPVPQSPMPSVYTTDNAQLVKSDKDKEGQPLSDTSPTLSDTPPSVDSEYWWQQLTDGSGFLFDDPDLS